MKVVIKSQDGESVEFEQMADTVYIRVDFGNKDNGKDATKKEEHEHTLILNAVELKKALAAIKV